MESRLEEEAFVAVVGGGLLVGCGSKAPPAGSVVTEAGRRGRAPKVALRLAATPPALRIPMEAAATPAARDANAFEGSGMGDGEGARENVGWCCGCGCFPPPTFRGDFGSCMVKEEEYGANKIGEGAEFGAGGG